MAKVELDNGTILYYKPHSLDKNIKYQELYNYLCRKNRTMFLKILILDVHRQKNFGNLKGSTPKEQYDYYEKKYLNNATYVKSLLQEYPELKRLLE